MKASTILSLVVVTFLSFSQVASAEISTTAVGNPIWEPADSILFTAPAASFESFVETLQTLLPPPNHEFDAANGGIVPGIPHAGPYDIELSTAVADAGFPSKTVYSAAEISGQPLAVFLATMLVPAPGTTGSNPDSAAGTDAIIPNTLFPIDVGIQLSLDGEIVRDFGFPVEALEGFDGHSHIPLFFAQATVPFLPEAVDPLGSYEWQISLRDVDGNGWDISAPFQVVPEPNTFAVLGLASLGLIGATPRSRRVRGASL